MLVWCIESFFNVLDWYVHKNKCALSVLLYSLDGYVVGVMYLLYCNVALWSL